MGRPGPGPFPPARGQRTAAGPVVAQRGELEKGTAPMPTLTRRAAPTVALAILAAATADAPAQQGGPAPIIVLPQVRPGPAMPQPVPPPAKQPASPPGTAQPSPGAPGGIPWPLISPGAS